MTSELGFFITRQLVEGVLPSVLEAAVRAQCGVDTESVVDSIRRTLEREPEALVARVYPSIDGWAVEPVFEFGFQVGDET